MADTNAPQAFSQTQSPSGSGPPDRSWKSLYKLGGTSTLIATLLVPAEIAISFFPSVEHATAHTVTVIDWFNLFQTNPFIALRNLGLLNVIGAILLAPAILAVYSALKREREAYAALGTILFFVGIAVYLASSKAFPMLSLSRQYMIATNDAQRSLLVSAGRAMLVEGQNRAGILIIEFGCPVVSLVMLKGHAFSKATAYSGTLGNALMIVLEIAFLPPRGVGVIVAAGGGLSTVIWYCLMGRRLLQLGRL